MKRCNEVKIDVLHYDESITVMTFCKGLLPESKLHQSLVKTRSNTMAEVLSRTQKYINLEAEQLRKIIHFNRRMSKDSRKCDKINKASQRRDPSKRNTTRNDAKDASDPFKQFSLNVTLTYKVNYLKGKNFVRRPRKMTSDLAKKDNSRYYAFHREVVHTTEECRILKNEILKLIQSRYLKESMFKQRS